MTHKEQIMENWKFQNVIYKSCRNKVLIYIGMALLLCGCIQKPITYCNENIYSTGGMPFKVCNVKYFDTIYQVLPEFVNSPKIYFWLDDFKETDIITVDSLVFAKLKDGIVHCQRHMELMLQKDTRTLIDIFFDDKYMTFNKVQLSIEEEKFLIYILLCRGVTIFRSCESGYLLYDPKSINP